MTSVGPYSLSTLQIEPKTKVFLGIKTKPGTFLDFISKVSPSYLNLIRLAGMEAFFNSPIQSNTFFLSECQNFKNDSDFARRLITMSTLKGIVTTGMMNNGLILFPLNSFETIVVKTFEENPIDTSNCIWNCSTIPSTSSCSVGQVDCTVFQQKKPCLDLKNRIIQINNKTITKGDILVDGGIIHILDSPLSPYF
jgi:hypothetical protein